MPPPPETMTDIPFPILVAFTFLFGCLFVLHLHRRQQDAQRALPERAEYLAKHGQQAPACDRCGSNQLKEMGLHDSDDARRIVSCAGCNQMLYRYERETAAQGRDGA